MAQIPIRSPIPSKPSISDDLSSSWIRNGVDATCLVPSVDLDDSVGSATGPSHLRRNFFYSSESKAGSATNLINFDVPSLIDEPFDETVNPFEVKPEPDDWNFNPA